MAEWTATNLDVSPSTANQLPRNPWLQDEVAAGRMTVERAMATFRLAGLQPHHVRTRSDGGDHNPDNLATLCWFHHHVAIHGAGFELNRQDPPGCKRLVAPRSYRGPPE